MERTFGATRDCRGCRFWSELVAKVDHDRNDVVALCMAPDRKGLVYTHGLDRCPSWLSGHNGPVDLLLNEQDYDEANGADDAGLF